MPNQPKQLQNFILEPKAPDSDSQERSRWQKFVSVFLPWFSRNVERSDRAIAASVEKVQADARVAAATANRLTAETEKLRAETDKLKTETDGTKTDNYRRFVELVDDNIKAYSEQAALKLKFAKLVETFPELEDQLARLEQYESEYGLRILSVAQDGNRET